MVYLALDLYCLYNAGVKQTLTLLRDISGHFLFDAPLFFPYSIYTSDKEPSILIEFLHVYHLSKHNLHKFESYSMKFIRSYIFTIIPTHFIHI